MKTQLALDGDKFLINNRYTYRGRIWNGRLIEGLLLNSRMIQGIFDDECPETVHNWKYPDTGVWDPDRNTAEFCAALPEYRKHGLLAVTVGLQGGGSIFTPGTYDHYLMSSFTREGELKDAYVRRLKKVLAAADDVGMIVIVNFFYWRQLNRMNGEKAVSKGIENAAGMLLDSGYRNIMIDLLNEVGIGTDSPIVPENIHNFLNVARSQTRSGEHIPLGSSAPGGFMNYTDAWLAAEDVTYPHGNGLETTELSARLRRLKEHEQIRRHPRPIVINEDSVFTNSLDAAISEHVSWGFYCQGYGSDYADLFNWKAKPRETKYAELSGFQTVPVNWNINDAVKRNFFERMKEITGS
jgi:hypothetical protein